METKEKLKQLHEKASRKKRISQIMEDAYKEDENIRKAAEEKGIGYLNRHKKPNYLILFLVWMVIGFLTGLGLSLLGII